MDRAQTQQDLAIQIFHHSLMHHGVIMSNFSLQCFIYENFISCWTANIQDISIEIFSKEV